MNKEKALEICNNYWKEQISKPNTGQEFIPAKRIIGTKEYSMRGDGITPIRISLDCGTKNCRVMVLDSKVLQDAL